MPVKCRGCGEPLPISEDDPYNELKHENNCLALKLGELEKETSESDADYRRIADLLNGSIERERQLSLRLDSALGHLRAISYATDYTTCLATIELAHQWLLKNGGAVEKREPLSERLKAKGFSETGEGDTISRKWTGPE